MKISPFVFGAYVAAREWQQPKYFDALEMMNQRSGGWGHPIGREAADYFLCANLTAPEHGTIECDQASCALKCDLGAMAYGRRRTKCRFTEAKGYFWKKTLGTCRTCDDLVAPEFLNQSCFNDKKGRKRCNLYCEWNQDLWLNGEVFKKWAFRAACKCPRTNFLGECRWKLQDKINNLTCIDKPSTTEAPTTFTGTGLPFTGMEGV